MSRILTVIISILFALPSAFAQSSQLKPKLVVVIVVDQMRLEYLSPSNDFSSAGFNRLLRDGFQFTETFHEHAVTETGVGHATISTGCYPSHHGIIANDWWDRAKSRWLYCAEDSGVNVAGHPELPGRSPSNLMKQTLGDWIRSASPQSKVFTVAGKDRAAILMAGLRANGAYWYNRGDGRFVTSIYYTPIYPAWVDTFNNGRPADDYFVGIWDRLLPRNKYAGPDTVAAEYDSIHSAFPHDFSPAPNQAPSVYYGELLYTPFVDQLTLRFARDLTVNESLGVDTIPDLLMVSCSAGDYIGHRYGPSSHEIQDQYFRLDSYLNSFFAFLDSTVGANNYVLALTSDHGVLPLPEELRQRNVDAGRINSDTLAADIMRVGAAIARELQFKNNVVLEASDAVILNHSEADTKGLGGAWLRKTVAANIKRIPYIVDVFTDEELSAGELGGRSYFSLYHNNYNPDRSPDIMLRFKEFWIISDEPHCTTHGTPYSYDRHVPLIFYGAGIQKGSSGDQCATVDIAPTLSDMIGITPPANIDGQSLLPKLRH